MEVERLLMEIIQSRKACVKMGRSNSYGNDLLGMLLDEIQKSGSLNLQLVMDECKTFFFAGHETTALLLTWTAMLLASNPSWQEKVRIEVKEIFNQGIPSIDQLSKLNVVSTFVHF
ncbi:cytokinin hydroxylase [Trifolium repens]|jgi:cytokinin trans-hydroxylase|nr:cytokinin hydroxylase [Trifolium repens]